MSITYVARLTPGNLDYTSFLPVAPAVGQLEITLAMRRDDSPWPDVPAGFSLIGQFVDGSRDRKFRALLMWREYDGSGGQWFGSGTIIRACFFSGANMLNPLVEDSGWVGPVFGGESEPFSLGGDSWNVPTNTDYASYLLGVWLRSADDDGSRFFAQLAQDSQAGLLTPTAPNIAGWSKLDSGSLAFSSPRITREQAYAFDVFSPSPPLPVPSPFATANARDRLRASVSESTGSLLSAVEAVPVEAGVSESYALAQQLEGSTLRRWREATRDQDSVEADFAYYPSPQQNEVMEAQYRGSTVLSRLRTFYPPRAFGRVDALGLSPLVDGRATAQTVITHLLTQWANLVPWLEFEPVPDLRMAMPGDPTPTEYANDAALGRVLTSTLQVRQDGSNKRNALDILQDLLSPFPGTILRQNASGKLVIVPSVGPDADDPESPPLVLRDVEVYSVSRGAPDPFGRVNRATFTNTPTTLQDDVPVMQPAWFQIGDGLRFGRTGWFSPPGDRVNLQPPSGTGGVLQQELPTSGASFNDQQPGLWPYASGVIRGGDGSVRLVDSSSNPLITVGWRTYAGATGALKSSGTSGLTMLNGGVVPGNGNWQDVARWTGSGSPQARITIRARVRENGVQLQATNVALSNNCFIAPCDVWIVEFTLNDASTGFAEGAQRSGTFGVIEDLNNPSADDDVIPGVNSPNALAESQLALGIIEATVNVRSYELDNVTLAAAAQAFVLRNIRPQVVREVEVSPTGARVAAFDNLGRLVQLPNGNVGRLIGVDYADDFTNPLWRKNAQVEVPDPTGVGAVNTTAAFLLLESGNFWLNDDGMTSEVA